MKLKSTILTSIAGVMLLSLPAFAQDNPPPKPDGGDTVKEAPHREAPKRETPHAPRQPEKDFVPFIGVLTREVAPELHAQLGLQSGFGLVVEQVMPDSPAKAAGIREHDVLIAFDEQRLVNMDQLMALVRSRKKGDIVTFTVISSGKESRVPVTIGEHMIARPEPSRFFGMRPGLDFPGSDRSRGDRGFPGPAAHEMQEQMQRFQQQMREQQERFHQQMREYQERVQNWGREGNRGPFPQPPVFQAPDPRGSERRPDGDRPDDRRPRESRDSRRSETHQSGNVTRSDDTGIYSLRHDDGRMIFSAQPKDGEQKSWPAGTEEERRAIPSELREKLHELERIRADMQRDDRGAPGPRGSGRSPENPSENDRRPAPNNPRPNDRPREDVPPPSRRDGGSI